MVNTRPHLGFVGPMVARHGQVTTQGEVLAGLFAAAGYAVTAVSTAKNRYVRLLDIIGTLITERKKIEVVCLQVFGGPSFVVEDIASRLGRLFRQKIVMALHGGALPEFMARYPRWTRKVLARADVLVAPSNFLARAVEAYGFQARVIPNVIDLSCYEYRHRRSLSPRLFWMRAFDPIWNPMMAVRAFAKLHSAVPEATLVMGGEDKGQELEVRELAKTLGLNGAVRFSGFLEMPEKLREGSTADIFLNTNRIDNTPVSIIEACAMGLPVIAAKVGGIPDLIQDEETGLLVPDDDDDAMVAAIKRLLADESLAARLSENGRRLAERSSWTNVLPEWERLFAEIRTRPHGSSAD